ncbi:conserved protein of unknown function [Candidatus Promineifilum breve]|uniref:DUF1638 domain-containing protein n=1 Tax=Candidatus Promineifilum breve TaxID=1806508 RepID=A0A160T0G0_9CHLR|nr:DUF1638 domain-containing protein [Candidatus Promineifilum breve]CUS02198.2 conserved protein of unknown function [Candidatus Promineifilum breve]
MTTAFIICGALAREVVAIVKRQGWTVDVFGIPAIEHMTPERIAPAVERKFLAIRERYDRVLVVYGDCGTRGALDTFLARHDLARIDGPHCYEMYGGPQFDTLMDEEPGTFFLTDFLVRGFRGTVWRGLGLDRYPELLDEYFRNYKRLVYLVQQPDDSLTAKAQEIADTLRLPLEIRHTGYGLLERRLCEWMATPSCAQVEEENL